MKEIMRLKRVYKMISATAPPGMPIERGMVASWIPETSQPGSREYDKIMGCSACTADKPWDPGKQLPLGFSASPSLKKIIYYSSKQQAAGRTGAASNKQRKLLTPAVGPVNVSFERKHNENT